MLAYELYLGNKGSTSNVVPKEKPIKKIFVDNNDNIEIDQKTLEEYDSKPLNKFRILQESLTMPLNTCDSSLLNLPDQRTSTNQPNPYVEISGNFSKTNSSKTNVKCEISLIIRKTTKDNENVLTATYDILNDKISIDAHKDIQLRIDTNNYYLPSEGKKKLFEKYVESVILSQDTIFSAALFTKVANEFFRYAKNIKTNLPKNDIRKQNFSIYLLPTRSTIEYDNSSETSKELDKNFIDSFGNSATSYASKSTTQAKFLSFYDKAFTINCKEGNDFYRNIGIGKESFQYIYLPADRIFRIGGFNWIFIDLNDKNQKFIETNQGILTQLYNNYQLLNSKDRTKSEKSLLKIICYRQDQRKQEIIIDDNLTMDRMRRLFYEFDSIKLPRSVLEDVMIYRDEKVVLWNNYVYAIRSFLHETIIQKDYLITFFTKRLKREISKWLKQGKEKRKKMENDFFINFFERTNFCLKALSIRDINKSDMNTTGELFAYQVGKLARNYVDFKRKMKEENKSLRDILLYSEYDRERLRSVVKRIAIGINLSKADSQEIRDIDFNISKEIPQDEIPDTEAFNDYSYFFYKGYFQGGGDSK